MLGNIFIAILLHCKLQVNHSTAADFHLYHRIANSWFAAWNRNVSMYWVASMQFDSYSRELTTGLYYVWNSSDTDIYFKSILHLHFTYIYINEAHVIVVGVCFTYHVYLTEYSILLYSVCIWHLLHIYSMQHCVLIFSCILLFIGILLLIFTAVPNLSLKIIPNKVFTITYLASNWFEFYHIL